LGILDYLEFEIGMSIYMKFKKQNLLATVSQISPIYSDVHANQFEAISPVEIN
jgi:hypothetical protein